MAAAGTIDVAYLVRFFAHESTPWFASATSLASSALSLALVLIAVASRRRERPEDPNRAAIRAWRARSTQTFGSR